MFVWDKFFVCKANERDNTIAVVTSRDLLTKEFIFKLMSMEVKAISMTSMFDNNINKRMLQEFQYV